MKRYGRRQGRYWWEMKLERDPGQRSRGRPRSVGEESERKTWKHMERHQEADPGWQGVEKVCTLLIPCIRVRKAMMKMIRMKGEKRIKNNF